VLDKGTFWEELQIMFQAHHVFKPQDKVSVFYRFFKNEKPEHLRGASELAAKELEKFPTVARFSMMLDRVKRDDPSCQRKKEDCHFCKGNGTISAQDESDRWFTFACNCPNAVHYGYPAWRSKHRETFRIYNCYVDMVTHPELYHRGLALLKANRVHMPEDIEQKILRRIDRIHDNQEPPF